MRQLISLLLIPFFVLGQALPHSHAGIGLAEASHHALRPHVHIHGHDHDHDEHRGHADEVETSSQKGQLLSTADHDSDAVYFAASTHLVTRSAEALPVDVLVTNVVTGFVPLILDSGIRFRASEPPDRYAALPIFLLTASLRL